MKTVNQYRIRLAPMEIQEIPLRFGAQILDLTLMNGDGWAIMHVLEPIMEPEPNQIRRRFFRAIPPKVSLGDEYFFTEYVGMVNSPNYGTFYIFEKPIKCKDVGSRPVLYKEKHETYSGNNPACDVCGAITVKSGPHGARVYKCMNCGNTMGAS